MKDIVTKAEVMVQIERTKALIARTEYGLKQNEFLKLIAPEREAELQGMATELIQYRDEALDALIELMEMHARAV